jgi:spore cortex protein
MKKHLIGLAAAALIIASGCNADNEQGQEGTTNQNIQPVRYKNNTDDNDQNRNYTLQRDLEEPRNTGINTRNINNTNNNDRNGNGDRDRVNNHDNNTNRYDVAEEAADLIVKKIDVIDNAYVITTDNNAYVAAALDTNQNGRNLDRNQNGDELTEDVKDKISAIVKSVDHNIDHVYVSTNPDFMDLANNYANDVNRGKPVEGLFEEIGNMIERVFPQNR